MGQGTEEFASAFSGSEFKIVLEYLLYKLLRANLRQIGFVCTHMHACMHTQFMLFLKNLLCQCLGESPAFLKTD